MSRQNTRYILVFLAVVILSFQPNKSFAIQGACSSHGGVNCSGFDSDGSAICNDGWVNSSVSFYSVDECSNCSSYLYHTGCKNKYDLDAIGNDYGSRGLIFSGAYIAAKDQCDAEIQDYSKKQEKYQQCTNLRDEAARVWSNHLDTKLSQLLEHVNTTPQCPPNSSYNSATNNCPCVAGYAVNDSKTSCIPTPQTIIKPQPSYSYTPPQSPPSPDPIELCLQKLGPHGVVAGQNLCGCVQGYILNEAKNSCVQPPVETKSPPIRETSESEIFTEFVKNNVKKPIPEITTKKDVEPMISPDPKGGNVIGATSPSPMSATTSKAEVQQKQSLIKRLISWFKSLFR